MSEKHPVETYKIDEQALAVYVQKSKQAYQNMAGLLRGGYIENKELSSYQAIFHSVASSMYDVLSGQKIQIYKSHALDYTDDSVTKLSGQFDTRFQQLTDWVNERIEYCLSRSISVPAGMIMTAGPKTEQIDGYYPCDGASYNIADNIQLFSAIGFNYTDLSKVTGTTDMPLEAAAAIVNLAIKDQIELKYNNFNSADINISSFNPVDIISNEDLTTLLNYLNTGYSEDTIKMNNIPAVFNVPDFNSKPTVLANKDDIYISNVTATNSENVQIKIGEETYTSSSHSHGIIQSSVKTTQIKYFIKN